MLHIARIRQCFNCLIELRACTHARTVNQVFCFKQFTNNHFDHTNLTHSNLYGITYYFISSKMIMYGTKFVGGELLWIAANKHFGNKTLAEWLLCTANHLSGDTVIDEPVFLPVQL